MIIEEPTWITIEGEVIPIKNMEDSHLLNSILMLRKKLKQVQESPVEERMSLKLLSLEEEMYLRERTKKRLRDLF